MRFPHIIGFTLFCLSGCQLPVITGKNNFFDYRNERVAIIAFKAADSVSEIVWDGMLNTARQQIQDHPEVNQAFFAKDAPAARVPESNLAIRLQRFTTTLALTGIADRDLALPLKKDLNANLLFLLQLPYHCHTDFYPQLVNRPRLINDQSYQMLLYLLHRNLLHPRHLFSL